MPDITITPTRPALLPALTDGSPAEALAYAASVISTAEEPIDIVTQNK